MSILGRLFPNPHAKDALIYLDSLDRLMAPQIAWSGMKARVRSFLAAQQRAVRRAVVVEGMAIPEVVLNAITTETTRDLINGRDHIYRGVLSDVGKSKRAIYDGAVSKLVRSGFLTEDEARTGRAALDSDLARVG